MQNIKYGNAVKNDDWITENSVPDPDPLPQLPGYHILIRPVSIRKETKGGILLPDQFTEDVKYLTTVGRVLAIGESAYQDKNKFPNGAWCSVGDYVAYGRHVGHKFIYKGIRLLLVFDDQIIMNVESPETLDIMYNLSADAA
jgi:co-chaperonin GroES (HSP10)|tara:strand:+ start:113 stop:538 length:426 start_codon:yes stop_codon:yes gene_type:complete